MARVVAGWKEEWKGKIVGVRKVEESIELGRRGRNGKLIMDGGRRSIW